MVFPCFRLQEALNFLDADPLWLFGIAVGHLSLARCKPQGPNTDTNRHQPTPFPGSQYNVDPQRPFRHFRHVRHFRHLHFVTGVEFARSKYVEMLDSESNHSCSMAKELGGALLTMHICYHMLPSQREIRC